MNFSPIALQVPTLLLPGTGVDLTRWAVVACDQYTSQPDYWTRVDAQVGDAPSTLRLILPGFFSVRRMKSSGSSPFTRPCAAIWPREP